MYAVQNSRYFRHFARHLFLLSKVYRERGRAKSDLDSHLKNMRNSIIRMRLSYKDVDRLKEKIEIMIDWERRYSRFFKPEDTEIQDLRNRISSLENELKNEREKKQHVVSENSEKIRELTESLNNIKSQVMHLMMDRAKRHHRIKALEQKITGKAEPNNY
ncbi:hypothetical protein HYW20_05900 [Candidatus Woesearchaeota archaeon]|nr:hypothetical protein [Candidatus Woesearchaeota archaeon]